MYKQLAKSIREFKKVSIKGPVFITLEVLLECTIPFVIAQLVNQIKAGCEFSVIAMYGAILVIIQPLPPR